MKKSVPRFTQETREQYVAHIVRRLRRKATRGRRRRWKNNAWVWLIHALKLESGNMKWAGPVDVAVYTGFVMLALEYLEKFPNQSHLGQLHDRVLTDLSILDLYRESMPDFMYTDEELYLLDTSVWYCAECLDRLETLCPDTT